MNPNAQTPLPVRAGVASSALGIARALASATSWKRRPWGNLEDLGGALIYLLLKLFLEDFLGNFGDYRPFHREHARFLVFFFQWGVVFCFFVLGRVMFRWLNSRFSRVFL